MRSDSVLPYLDNAFGAGYLAGLAKANEYANASYQSGIINGAILGVSASVWAVAFIIAIFNTFN